MVAEAGVQVLELAGEGVVGADFVALAIPDKGWAGRLDRGRSGRLGRGHGREERDRKGQHQESGRYHYSAHFAIPP